MKYLHSILKIVNGNEDFDILLVKKYSPKNIKSFVKEVYSFDYAPFWHLKSKTEYLLKTKMEVCFIFIRNKNPDIDYFGENNFRHEESVKLKGLKEELRKSFNPRDEFGNVTHDHVIHATDNESQADKMLKFLDYELGANTFDEIHSPIESPFYLRAYNHWELIKIEIGELMCSVIEGESWKNYKVALEPLENSAQYKGLKYGMGHYQEYLDKFIGGPLTMYYDTVKFDSLSNNFQYLSAEFETSYIQVLADNDNYIIVDGLHRAAICMHQGLKEVVVCKMNEI
jgi:hypothetical protein